MNYKNLKNLNLKNKKDQVHSQSVSEMKCIVKLLKTKTEIKTKQKNHVRILVKQKHYN